MTAISTLLSVIMLPLNLTIYTWSTYSSDVVNSLDWTALFVELVVVISGIVSGILCSARLKNDVEKSTQFHKLANKMGNVAGFTLITFSVAVSASNNDKNNGPSGGGGGGRVDTGMWDQDAVFYIGVALPAVFGITIATYIASKFDLEKPERVAVVVESVYQNTGIVTSVAITMFSGEDLAEAIIVPLYYGMCEALLLGVFCVVCWKLGWTKAPNDESFCVMLYSSYEVIQMDDHIYDESIEVVLSGEMGEKSASGCSGDDNDDDDLAYSNRSELIYFESADGSGYKIDEQSLENANVLELMKQQQREIDENNKMFSISLDGPPFINNNKDNRNSEDSSERSTSSTGRIGRAVAMVKARGRGYRKAPRPSDDYKNERIPEPSTLGLAASTPSPSSATTSSSGAQKHLDHDNSFSTTDVEASTRTEISDNDISDHSYSHSHSSNACEQPLPISTSQTEPSRIQRIVGGGRTRIPAEGKTID